jgi:hypothetical protein
MTDNNGADMDAVEISARVVGKQWMWSCFVV